MASETSIARRCHAITTTGEACRAQPLTNQDYCLAHADAKTRESVGFIANNGKAGRPRVPRASELMRQKVEDEKERIIGVYWDAMHATRENGEPDHQIRLQALRDLLDRVYGKPTTKTELTGDLTLDLISLAARAAGELEDAG